MQRDNPTQRGSAQLCWCRYWGRGGGRGAAAPENELMRPANGKDIANGCQRHPGINPRCAEIGHFGAEQMSASVILRLRSANALEKPRYPDMMGTILLAVACLIDGEMHRKRGARRNLTSKIWLSYPRKNHGSAGGTTSRHNSLLEQSLKTIKAPLFEAVAAQRQLNQSQRRGRTPRGRAKGVAPGRTIPRPQTSASERLRCGAAQLCLDVPA